MALAALVVLASALHFLGGQVADPDLWQHLRDGEIIRRTGAVPRTDAFSYTAWGSPVVDHEWLAQWLFAWAFALVGGPGLVALKIAAGAALLFLLLDAARTMLAAIAPGERINPLTAAVVLVLALAVVSPGATFRPQLFTVVLLALEAALLARAERRRLAAEQAASGRRIGWELAVLPAVLLVWANLHGGFVVGVGMLVVYAAAVAVRAALARRGAFEAGAGPSPREAVATVAVALAGALATLVTPYGSGLHLFLAQTLHAHAEISEWYPVPALSADFLRFKLLVLGSAAAVALLWRERHAARASAALLSWQAPFLALAAAYAFRHQRHTVLFAVAAAPLLIVAAERARLALVAHWPALRPRRPVMAAAVAGVAAVALFQIHGWARTLAAQGLEIRYGRLDFPADAVEFLRAHGIGGNVAMPFEWGSYAIWKLAPDARVFIDGRFETLYPPKVIDDYFAFMHGTDGWERLLDDYSTEVVVVQRWRDIHPRLFKRPDLVYVYSDPAALVFVRRTPTNAAALDRLALLWDRATFVRQDTVFP